MIRPDKRPAIFQPGLKAPNGLAPPFNALFRRSAAAAALLVLALSLAPSAQAQGQVCDSTTIGNVRLQDGKAVNEGRLEICADDPDDSEGPVWGVICDDYWTTTDAHVACRQLGYTHAQSGAAGLLQSFFGRGTGPILLDDMLCDGDEADLLECRTNRGSMAGDYIGQHNCTLNENVGIRCLDATIDASLSDLYVRDANGVVTLNPRFESAHEDYSVSVPNETTTVTVYATPSQGDATVEYFDSNNVSLGTGASAVVSNLAVGATVVTVKVTAPDDITEMLYTVTINRAAQVSNPPPPPPPPSDPVVTLILTPDSISENGGLSTVTATVSPVPSVAFTVTVSAQANSPGVAGDFDLVGTTLSFGADAAQSTGSVTITANDNDEDASNKTVTVSGSVTASGIEAPANVTLTITDDDEPDPIDTTVNPPEIEDPVVTLVLSPNTISENGGVSTVTATVSPASPDAFTVTISTLANLPAVAGDFDLAGTTLSFSSNATNSSGSVTITAVDNSDDAPNKTVTVSGTVSLSDADDPASVTLTITDDDEPDSIDPPVNPPVVETPVVTLVLSPDSISENGGVSTVTATVSPASPDAFTVTISALANLPTVAGDFDLAGATLSFSSNATNSSGSVTITAVDNSDDAPNKTVTVSGTVSLSDADDPASVTLTITDDDGAVQNNQPKSDQRENPPGNQKPQGTQDTNSEDPSVDPPVTQVPVVTLVLSPGAIGENGGVSTVTATASPASAQAFTVTVSANAVSPAASGDFTLTGTTLSFAANATESTGSVTITAVDNQIDAPDKEVTVSGTVSLPEADAPDDVTLTITDDETAPEVSLVLMPGSISENGGVSTVTATASPASAQAFTVTVSANAVSPAASGDFTLTGTTLSFAANATESTGSVTITAVDNQIDAPDKEVTVSGTVSLPEADAPDDVTLTITDDETAPEVSLVLMPGSISENGGVSTVTATASPASAQAFTVTVSANAVSPAASGDFTLTGTTLSFAANATESTGSVTITAVDNQIDAPDKEVTVSGTVSLPEADAPDDVTLTITDDETAPEVSLVLMPGSISENGGVSTVTATASPASAQAFTVTVSANAVSPAASGDFTLTGTTLSFAANATESTGSVTITAVDNQIDAPDKEVTVSGTVSLPEADAPDDVTLTITDDETAPEVSLVLMPGSISENGGMGTVTAIAWPASSEPFEVMVSAQAVAPTVPGDFRQTGNMLSFGANATESTGSVTVSAVDNRIYAPDKIVMVYGTVSRPGIADPEEPMLTIMDDEALPVVTIALTPGSISENGGVSTVTATASPASSSAFTVTISAEAVSPAVAGDFALAGTTLGFGPNATESSGTVTISAVNNRTDAPDKSVTISGELSLSGADVPTDVTLTIADDDEPLPELSIADASGRESDGSLVFDVSLNKPWDVPVTFDYATADGTATAGADYLSTSGTLSINAGVTSARIEVRVLPDVLNEEDESFSLSLSQVSEASLADGHAVGVITGGDPSVTAQWLARFGRTVADHVLGAVEDQLWSKRGGSQEVTVAGWNLSGPGVPVSGDGMSNGLFAQSSPGFRGFGSGGGSGWGTVGLNMPGADSHGAGPGGRGGLRLTERDLLSGSALRLNVGGFGRGEWHMWARGAYSRFDGSDGDLMMQGEVRSASVGVDYGCVRCLFGVSLTHSSADGNFGFGTRDSARVESEVTGLYPYFGYQVSDRLWVWGVAGYGTGDMTAVPATGVEVEQADLTTRLAAVGARGDLLSGVGGYSLALKADAMMVHTRTDEEIGLIETEGEAQRVRVGLEGSHVASFENKSSFRSYLDLALRGDSGDAEDGFGFEVGGGLDWYDLVPGLAVNLGARGLIAHGEDEFEEWGFSGGLRYDPTPASPEGLQVGITRSWGAPLNGGLQSRMWADAPARHSAAMQPRQHQQFNAELAYGLDTRRGIGIPWARAGLFGSGKEYRLGYSMLTRHGVPSLQVGESMYGRDYRLGWDVNVDCRAQVTLELSHIEGIREDGSDTGITLRFRSLMHRPGTLECIADLRVHTLKP